VAGDPNGAAGRENVIPKPETKGGRSTPLYYMAARSSSVAEAEKHVQLS